MQSTHGQTHSMTRALSVVVALAMFAASPHASATTVSATGTVVAINGYSEWGSGDFVFRLSTYAAGCDGGFWLSPSQPGFKTTVALIMQARATGESIIVGGNDAQIWNGSGSKFCKVDSVAFN